MRGRTRPTEPTDEAHWAGEERQEEGEEGREQEEAEKEEEVGVMVEVMDEALSNNHGSTLLLKLSLLEVPTSQLGKQVSSGTTTFAVAPGTTLAIKLEPSWLCNFTPSWLSCKILLTRLQAVVLILELVEVSIVCRNRLPAGL